MPFTFERLSIPQVVLIQPRVFSDSRGFFLETYKHSDFAKFGIGGHLVQENESRSVRGVLRGLHYQKNPKAQGKLVRCLDGRIFDVAADIRRGSPYFGKWVGVELSDQTKAMLYIPTGFAHGFVVLSDVAEVLYKCTEEYAPAEEAGIIWNDHQLGISWPMDQPILSERDRMLPPLEDADLNFIYEDGR
jgi:dTDP-4-dehydrorhamnose 3,5-epimerase